MMVLGRKLTAVILFFVSIYAAANQSPQGVSPGASDRILEIEGRCPAFMWEVVPHAQAFEIVAYRLQETDDTASLSNIELSDKNEVLFTKVPGGASGWTPSMGQCLEAGGTYAWFVRAVFPNEDLEGADIGKWSSAKFFSVSASPSIEEIEHALDVLRRYSRADNQETTDAVQINPTADFVEPTQQTGSSHDSVSLATRSVISAKTAIKGTLSDVSGETYGVVGVSASPAGAGLGAANTGGGPDLVLDASGGADARFSESGIDRPSSASQTFTIQNSGSGAMTLDVEGAISGDDLVCPGCVDPYEVTFNYAGAWIKGGAAASLDCAGSCVSDSEVANNISINNSRLYAPSGAGSVGIGTTSPEQNLHVHGGAFGRALISGTMLGLLMLGDSDAAVDSKYFFVAGESDRMSLGTINDTGSTRNSKLTIKRDNGYVGINEWTPVSSLHVSDGCITGTLCSDLKLKTDIRPFSSEDSFIDGLQQLRAVSFQWKHDVNAKRRIGLVAQEVEKVFPEVVGGSTRDDGHKGLSCTGLNAILVEATKEQQRTIDALVNRVHDLEERLR